ASPANKPRVFSSRNTVRAKNFADQSAHTPKYPSKNGLRGKRSSGPRIIGASELQRDASGEKILDHIAPSRPKPRAVCFTSRSSNTAVPSSHTCASGADG